MKKLIYLIVITTLIISGCGGKKQEQPKSVKVSNGGIKYGGIFKLNELSDFKSLYPLNIGTSIEQRISSQIYQGLVKLDQENLKVIPSLSEKWEVNEDATSFTFHIRKDIKFHDDPCFEDGIGRNVTAKDFKYCLDRVCVRDVSNQMYFLFKDRVKGAEEYHQSVISGTPLEGGVEGIKVIDDYTIQIDLEYSFAGFLNIISHIGCSVYPKEAVETYGDGMRIKCIGTGPFRVKRIKESEVVILEKNPKYWEKDQFGNQLPYLDAIKVSFIKEKKSELLEFKKGNLDMVYRLPLEMIKNVVSELEEAKKGGNKPFVMQNVSAMSLFYIGFQHKLPPFDNIDVRKAFNYAVDKKSIVTYTMQGEGRAGMHGIVPPFKGYDYENVKGYEYSPEKAKEHLKTAGYNNGKGFPEITLQINPGGGDRNIQVAEVVQKMLNENLNINLKIEQMPFVQHLQNLETGKATLWRAGWDADYPDPETFLNLLYGKHVPEEINSQTYLNTVRYESEIFDEAFTKSLREVNESKRMELYRKADQIAVDDAAIMPIFYDENTRLIHTYVKNFPSNAMEYRDLTSVYFDYDEE